MTLKAQDIAELIRNTDCYAVIQTLHTQPPETLGELYSNLVIDLYWKAKDLPATVTVARAGIQKLLDTADSLRQFHEDSAKIATTTAMAIAYNLASFTWPGWNEHGIDCSPFLADGLNAARAHMRLVREMVQLDLQISRAYWILGAQLMAAQKWTDAQEQFLQGAPLAASAGAPAEEMLCLAFASLASHLSGTAPDAKEELAERRTRLIVLDGGPNWDSQIETALAVFANDAEQPLQ